MKKLHDIALNTWWTGNSEQHCTKVYGQKKKKKKKKTNKQTNLLTFYKKYASLKTGYDCRSMQFKYMGPLPDPNRFSLHQT